MKCALSRIFAIGLAALPGCAATAEPSPSFTGGRAGADESAGGAPVDETPDLVANSESPVGSVQCTDELSQIFLVGNANELYRYAPGTDELNLVGTIDCPVSTPGATPFSMAVARTGIAWVLFNDGNIFHVNTVTAECAATDYVPGQQGFELFGMGFVSDEAGSEEETLYISSLDAGRLGKLDTQTLDVTFVSNYDDYNSAAELTGTGDARLYGFFHETPVVIAEIDKRDGAILSSAEQRTVNIGLGWAFAFWGGDFWLFTSPTGFSSDVDRYRPSSGATTTVRRIDETVIVGAGVSTCAPVEAPK